MSRGKKVKKEEKVLFFLLNEYLKSKEIKKDKHFLVDVCSRVSGNAKRSTGGNLTRWINDGQEIVDLAINDCLYTPNEIEPTAFEIDYEKLAKLVSKELKNVH